MNSDHPLGRGHEGFEGRGRFDRQMGEGGRFDWNVMREMPDSLRRRIGEAEREHPIMRKGVTDSIRQRFNSSDRKSGDRMSFEGGRRRASEFCDGRKVSLGTLGWFLTVFAVFTVIFIYVESKPRRVCDNVGFLTSSTIHPNSNADESATPLGF